MILITLIIATLLFPQGYGYISPKMNETAVKENEKLLRNCDRQLEELRNCKIEPHFDVISDGRPLDSYLCSFEGTGNATILLAGNSFVMRQYESIIKVSKHKFKKLYLATQSMCTIFTRQNEAIWKCNYVSNRLKEFMTVLKPDLMIVTQRLSVGNLFNTPLNTFKDAKNDSITTIMKEYWKEYSELTKNIIIIEPHPTMYDSPKENLAKLLSLNASLDNYYISQKDYNAEVNPGWWRTLASIENCPKCSTISIRQHFCHNSTKECDIYDHQKFLTYYCDPGHFTTIGVEKFIRDLAAAINKVI
uniref:SGNH domain-containing protein n=1 Tax=Panagrolaimus davidi TaxID=227884 RepID=A0A914PZ90_9BILA